MESPHNGHRRHDTGSITVVDLIKRQQGPVRIPSADEQATIDFVDDLLGPDLGGDRHRSWMAKAAKLVGLGVGSLVLCGSVVAASALTRTHRLPPAAAPASQASILTGVDALRPDTLAAQLSGQLPGYRAAPNPVDNDATTHPAASTVPFAGAAHPVPLPPVTAPSAQPLAHLSAADVVRDFFQEATTTPSAAVRLVDPSLLASDPIGFAQSWTSMSKLKIESITTNPDGSVQAVVRMLDADGAWMQVAELLHVTDGENPVITGAELLSAQHG